MPSSPTQPSSSSDPARVAEHDGLLAALADTGALRTGHFSLSSGLHSDRYVQCARLTERPRHARTAGDQLARRLAARGLECDVVVGPALGGIIVAHELARALDVRCQFAERPAGGGPHVLRRGFVLQPTDRVVIAEDVITTGGSALAVADLVRSTGAAVVGIACIVDRRSQHGPEIVGVPLVPLLELSVFTWAPEDCPQCSGGIPVDHPGSSLQPATVRPSV